VTALLLALLALQTPVDEGTLVVREDTAEIARERFRLTALRTTAGATRWTFATTVRYDRSRPVIVLDPIVELGADSNPASLEYNVADPRDPLCRGAGAARGRATSRPHCTRQERREDCSTKPHLVAGSSP